MKIYQLHEYGGEWEDRYDYIIGSYLRKERAEEEKAKVEAEEVKLMEQDHKCNHCPFLDYTNSSLDDLYSLYPDYCSQMDLEKDEYNNISCINYYLKWDKSYFKIIEVEVEE